MRFAAFLAIALASHAAVRRVEIVDRAPITHNYERLTGRVYFGADPPLPANRIVRDLEFAPVNARGEVEFSAEFYLLRPLDAAKSNGTVLFEVSNRGGKGMLSRFNFSQSGEFGDGYTMQQGYTLAWLGWEWDIPASAAAGGSFTTASTPTRNPGRCSTVCGPTSPAPAAAASISATPRRRATAARSSMSSTPPTSSRSSTPRCSSAPARPRSRPSSS